MRNAMKKSEISRNPGSRDNPHRKKCAWGPTKRSVVPSRREPEKRSLIRNDWRRLERLIWINQLSHIPQGFLSSGPLKLKFEGKTARACRRFRHAFRERALFCLKCADIPSSLPRIQNRTLIQIIYMMSRALCPGIFYESGQVDGRGTVSPFRTKKAAAKGAEGRGGCRGTMLHSARAISSFRTPGFSIWSTSLTRRICINKFFTRRTVPATSAFRGSEKNTLKREWGWGERDAAEAWPCCSFALGVRRVARIPICNTSVQSDSFMNVFIE